MLTLYVVVSMYGLKHVQTFRSLADLTLWTLNSIGFFKEDFVGAQVRRNRMNLAVARSSASSKIDGSNARLSSSAIDGGRRARRSLLGERLRCS